MSEPRFQLAQVNVGRALAPIHAAQMADFVANLNRINRLAEAATGFVWRLKDVSGNATGIDVGGDPRLIVNLSVWESREALFDFVYRSGHTKIMARRKEWFEPYGQAYMALWWCPAGSPPTLDEAMRRLALLERRGPSPQAFTFKQSFPPPSVDGQSDAAD